MDLDLDLDLNKYMNWEFFDVFKGGNLGSFGSSLLEVFNVRISKQTEVYGTFSVEDTEGTLDYFKRPCKDIGSFQAKGTLPLTQPSRIIPAAGTIIFHLDLKDKHGNEFIKGRFPLNLMDASTSPCKVFDNYLVAHIKGIQSSARIYYTIPIIALQSVIKIQFIKGDHGMGYSYVTGRIIARYGNDYDNSADEDIKKYSWFLLYDKSSKDKHFQLKDEDFLPLLRSSYVVAAQSSVVIKLNLEFHHSNGLSEPLEDYEIQFPTSIYRFPKEDIVVNGRTTLKVKAKFVPEFISAY